MYHSHFLESALLAILCFFGCFFFFTYTAINNPLEETWPTRSTIREVGGGTNWITTSRQKTRRRWKVPARVPTRFCEILNYVQTGVAMVSRMRGSWIMARPCFIRTQKDSVSFSPLSLHGKTLRKTEVSSEECCDIFIPYYISALCKADTACSRMMSPKLTGIDGMTLQLVHRWKIAPWFHTETCFSNVFLSLIVRQGINSGPWHGR